jgi:energy-coupling factor transporter ATP-binding protein EcfA2
MTYPIPPKALQHHVAILGKTGSGKTTAAKAGAEIILDEGGRVCVVDPTGAWWGMKSSATGKSAGYPFVIFGGSHADFPLGATHGEAIAEIVGTSNTPAIIDTSQMKVSERTRFFTNFADAIMRKNRGPLHLIVDEAHLFMPQGKVPDPQSGQMLAAGNNMVSGGRSRGLRIMLITQRPAKLHKDALTQVETLVAMRLIAPQDRKAVEEWIKDNADQAKGREIIESLATLKVGQGWVWSPEVGVLERATFPRIRTFDSSAAPDGTDRGAGPVLAPVDSDTIRTRLSAIAADVVANDPRELKRRIAELERDAKKPRELAIDTESLAQAEARGIDIGFQRGAAAARSDMVASLAAITNASQTIKRVSAELEVAALAAYKANDRPMKAIATVHMNAKAQPATRRAVVDMVKHATRAVSDSISKPQQKLLDALAWLEDKGISPAPKNTLAAVAGVSPTSGGYFNNLGAMKSAGMIDYPQPGVVAFTTEGRAMSNPPSEDGEVHDRWLEIVTEPQAKILRALINAHPDPIEKDELAEKIGVSPTSGGYFNNLGSLRTLGAIDYPQKGFAALTRYVMP